MKNKSGFVHGKHSSGMQLMGLGDSGKMPSAKNLKAHVRASIKNRKSGPDISYARIIAQDIRKRSNDAANGGSWGIMFSNYYASHGLDPFKIARALANDTGLLPSSADTEDVANDSGLNRELEKLEGYLAGTYGSGPGYHNGGSYSFGRPGSGGGSGGSGSGSGSGGGGSNGSGSSGGGISSIFSGFGGNSTMWIVGGFGALALVMMMKD